MAELNLSHFADPDSTPRTHEWYISRDGKFAQLRLAAFDGAGILAPGVTQVAEAPQTIDLQDWRHGQISFGVLDDAGNVNLDDLTAYMRIGPDKEYGQSFTLKGLIGGLGGWRGESFSLKTDTFWVRMDTVIPNSYDTEAPILPWLTWWIVATPTNPALGCVVSGYKLILTLWR